MHTIVKPTDNHRHFGGQGQGVQGVREQRQQQGEGTSGADEKEGSLFSPQDYVVMSDEAHDLFQQLEDQFRELLRENPRYHRLLLGKNEAGKGAQNASISPMMTLAKAKTFLADEQYQRLANDDPHFAEFYSRVDRLVKVTHFTLGQAQQQLRNTSTPAYSRPAGVY